MALFGRWMTAACVALAAGSASAAPPPSRPKLIVALSIDQFSDELFQRYRASYTGGLRRLADGISFTGYQSHSGTETCPGHSTILTGRHPNATGIVANDWYDPRIGADLYCVAVPGAADPEARGPQNLRVSTFGDWLKAARPRTRVISISGKDRAAIMLGGHKADAVYWWKDGVGFSTSSYAGPATPAVTAPATAFNEALFARWRAAPPALWPTQVSATCAALEQPYVFGTMQHSGRIPPDGARAVVPGDLQGKAFKDQLRVSPLFDPTTLEFVDATIDRLKLGHGKAPDLLAVSLSATDYVGHRYGNGGAEMCVQMAALDQALGALFAKLDGLHIPYVVALTADHGSMDAAERKAKTGVNARRIDRPALVKALNAAVRAQLGLTADPISGDDVQQLRIIPRDEPTRIKVRDAALAWLKQQPDVVEAFPAEDTARAIPPRGKTADRLSTIEKFNLSYDKERSGDIQVELAEYTYTGIPHAMNDTVAGHGTPWDYDRRVPILFWWPGITPAQRPEPAETVDIAPTLAAIARIKAPEVDGKCLPMVAKSCR